MDKKTATALSPEDRFELLYLHKCADEAQAALNAAVAAFESKRKQVWDDYGLNPDDTLTIDGKQNKIERKAAQ